MTYGKFIGAKKVGKSEKILKKGLAKRSNMDYTKKACE